MKFKLVIRNNDDYVTSIGPTVSDQRSLERLKLQMNYLFAQLAEAGALRVNLVALVEETL